MTSKTKIIRTVYLYVAAIVSLIFLAVGTGILVNTGIKTFILTKAEKGGYGPCNSEPPVYGLSSIEEAKKSNITTAEQKQELDNLLKDYENWKENNTGEACYQAQRQKNVADSLTMILIALPICLFHWRVIKKEKEEKIEA